MVNSFQDGFPRQRAITLIADIPSYMKGLIRHPTTGMRYSVHQSNPVTRVSDMSGGRVDLIL